MEELLNSIAEQKGYSAEMVERSAAARAKADGVSVEDVLRAWAGVGDAPADAPPAAPAAPEPPPAPTAEAEDAPEPEESGPKVEVLAPEAAPPEGADEPAAAEPEPVPATAGRVGLPGWLAAAFIALPAIALLYVLVLPSGPPCGSAGALAIDPSTGVAENCDGSEFGTDGGDLFAVGDGVYTAQCAACHGTGGGGGAGPAFTNGAVLATFSSCTEHIEWVALGTAGWPDATYGDNAKPTGGGGVMPAFGNSLTAEELAAVVLYERVAFGGEDRAAADAACAPGDGEVTASAP